MRVAISLRSEPVEQPKPKRKKPAKWNPETRQLDYPPTKSQNLLINDLRKELGIDVTWPKTKREAGALINRLLRQRKKVKGNRRRHPSGLTRPAQHLGKLPPGLEPQAREAQR